MINTIYGKMEESLLVKKEGIIDDESEFTKWIEYWLDGKLVHRSAHIKLKNNLIQAEIQGID